MVAGIGGEISSSPSRNLAAGRRAREEERRIVSSNPAGQGSPMLVGLRGGRDNANRPRG